MRHLICAIFVMCLVTPAFTAEAGLSQGSIAVLAGPAGGPQLPDSRLAVNDSADNGGLVRYAQNLETGLSPEAAGDGAQPSEVLPRAESDGFQGGGTFDYFPDPRANQEARAGSPSSGQEYVGDAGTSGHEPPDQSDMEHYNLMMKAWQKD